MKTTLNAIRAHDPCASGWGKLLRNLGKTQADDEPLRISTIAEYNGLDDALWCLRAVEGHDREIRLYAVWCARQVQHLMNDPRSLNLNALDVAERHANGEATTEELDAASAAAWNATRAAAWAAAWAVAWESRAAAMAAAGDSAWYAASAAQKSELLRICAEIEAREAA